ncbi:MAG: hypothetical protein QOC66_3049 [Pseudonocardiales bacterium]|nr:hypothetical protein [Pseudonocardiales bacterium]
MKAIMSRSMTTAVAVAALAAPLLIAGPASARGGGDSAVRNSGRCVGGGVFELKAKHDDGRIEVEYEVDTNRAGQVWRVRLSDNGVLVFSGNATTVAPSGSFEVRRLIPNRAGSDRIRATATFGSRTCGGTVLV